MGRAPCCDKNGMKKGPWTPEEDQKLIDYIQQHGHGSWRTLPKNAGLARCGKSCRLRWTNYLRPDIKRGRFSFEEEETIIQLHGILGNKWSAIAARLPGRTDNEIKNYWNTHIRKRLLRMGIDPVTHSPRLDLLDLSSLLGPALCNPRGQLQEDLSRLVLGVEPLVNPELLIRIATDLFQSSGAINILQQDPQLPSPINLLKNPAAAPNCPWQDNGSDLVPAAADAYDLCYNGNMMEGFAPNFVQDQAFGFQAPSCEWNHYSNRMHESVLSTPSSSPTMNNSCSTHLNGSTEDDMDSYCSNLFQFQIPDLLDANDFM